MMGKGDKRRPSFVSNEEYADNYDRIFNGTEPETPVECTAIVKYTGAPWPTIKGPDLTKLDHPTACKYLVEGMKVKVLCKSLSRTRGWDNGWNTEHMDRYIGHEFIVRSISDEGVFFDTGSNYDWWAFPAFCLQIIEQENKNDS